MIAGRPTVSGETWSDVLARVIERAPDSQLLPGTTPPALRRLLERCLQKNPAKLWHHIGDVALDLDLAATERALPDKRRLAPSGLARPPRGSSPSSQAPPLVCRGGARLRRRDQ